MIILDTIEEYEVCKARGFDALLSPYFSLPIELRIYLQRIEFAHSQTGTGNIVQRNDRFYHYVWENKRHYCEECSRPLSEYSSVYISHIFSRGSHQEMAVDPRNTNILCGKCHDMWEHKTTRKKMRIYYSNLLLMRDLKKEYNEVS